MGDSYSSALSLYDNLGNLHILSMTFTKAGANDWVVSGALDDTDITANITDQGGGGPSDMIFDTNGSMTTGGAVRHRSERLQYRLCQSQPD